MIKFGEMDFTPVGDGRNTRDEKCNISILHCGKRFSLLTLDKVLEFLVGYMCPLKINFQGHKENKQKFIDFVKAPTLVSINLVRQVIDYEVNTLCGDGTLVRSGNKQTRREW